MPQEKYQTPLLHNNIYLPDALFDVTQVYGEKFSAVFNVVTEKEGWRLLCLDSGRFSGSNEILLREVMNEILARSLESRLEEMAR